MTIEDVYKRVKTTIFRAGTPEDAHKAVHGLNDLMKEMGCSDQDRTNVWGTLFSEDLPVFEGEGLISEEQARAIRIGINELAHEDYGSQEDQTGSSE